MNPGNLIDALSSQLDNSLAIDIVNEFIAIRIDCSTGTLERAAPGKFIETVVQVLQYLETGNYDEKPSVDQYLKNLESKQTVLSDDLRICCSRIARSCYTLRNKRNIAHKGGVNPSIYDLRYLYAGAQWILSELIRSIVTQDMNTAGRIIDFIQIPISSLVEDFGDRKLVYGSFTVEEEALVLLHSYFPDFVELKVIQLSLDRRSKSAISNSLKNLWIKKLIHRDSHGYRLTQVGYQQAIDIVKTELRYTHSVA